LFQEGWCVAVGGKDGGRMVESGASRLPELALEVIFSYLELRDVRNCALVCKRWCSFLQDENNEVSHFVFYYRTN
jgi:F-box protein 45